MHQSARLEEALFTTALALPTDERDLYLERACPDASTYTRVRTLLVATDQGEALFQSTPPVPPSCAADIEVDNYRVLQEIGEGGWGTVHFAEQLLPLRREVALKIIKLGMDTKAVILRFAAERQALAMMDHPNIAKVFDAGATHAGRPYFAMELVRGVKITDYCDLTRSSVAERIGLFLQVCQAIHHAHRRGIIHRDIKPSNVMVTLVDGLPVVKVIDFGVAKAIQGRLTDGTVFTAFDHFIGTPAYVSPEQAERGNAQVNARSDIYSLGVLLYELLCGCTPFAGKDLSASRMMLLRARMRSQEALPPSRKLRSLSAEAIARVTERCRTNRLKLIGEIQGDLDWVIMHCLESDPEKRYASALELSLDLQHYLHDEPVVARPKRVVYSLQKFAKRHRAVLATSAAVIAVLLSTTLLTTWLAIGATRANQLAESVENFLQNDLLVQNEFDQPDTELKLRVMLDRAAGKVGPRFVDEPLVEAPIRNFLGTGYAAIGMDGNAEAEFERALQLYEKHYGLRHRRTLDAMRQLVVSKMRQEQYADAERLGLRALQHSGRAIGYEDPRYLALETTVALAQFEQGRFAEIRNSVDYLVDAARRVLGAEDPTTLQSTWLLAAVALKSGDLSEAETLARSVLDARSRTLGFDHPETRKALGLLQLAYRQAGKCTSMPTVHAPVTDGGPYDEVIVVARKPTSIFRHSFEQIALQGYPSCSVDDPWSVDSLQRMAVRASSKK